jgi:pantothenate kinase-related protein Tda10
LIKCKNSCPLEKFEGCCFSCDLKETCKEACESNPSDCGEAIFEESDVVSFEAVNKPVILQITDIFNAKKFLDEQEKALKEQLQTAMEKHNIKKFSNDSISITYVAATTATSIDSKVLKAKYPAIAEECSKTSDKKAYVKVELMGVKK